MPTVPPGSFLKAALLGAKTVKGPFRLQRRDQAGRLDGDDERGVVFRVHRVLHDVFRGIHRRAADHHRLFVFHLRAVGRQHGAGAECHRQSGGASKRDGMDACHVALSVCSSVGVPAWRVT
jgi:hypothetical protein